MTSANIGTPKRDLDTPALCLDIVEAQANVERMAAFLRDGPVRLRPHTKTHKCTMLAQMQLQAGAIGITCAKLGEAEVMAAAGIKDILIANQIVGPVKIARLVNLAAYTEVIVCVDDLTNACELDVAAQAKGVRLRVLVEVNIGMERCGVLPGLPTLQLAQAIVAMPGLRFEGLMGYEGHAVFLPDADERRRVAEASLEQLVSTAALLRSRGVPVPIVSSGGTGTHLVTGRYPGVTEIEAGSYITMDAQYKETVGIDFRYALTVLSTVVSTHGERAIIDAGLKTVTRDFGLPLVLDPPGWQMTRLSEEHGYLERRGGNRLAVGDKVELVPNHGCTTINLHDEYHVVRGGVLEAIWPISARGKVK